MYGHQARLPGQVYVRCIGIVAEPHLRRIGAELRGIAVAGQRLHWVTQGEHELHHLAFLAAGAGEAVGGGQVVVVQHHEGGAAIRAGQLVVVTFHHRQGQAAIAFISVVVVGEHSEGGG